MGKLLAICTSPQRGTVKTEVVSRSLPRLGFSRPHKRSLG